MTHVEVLMEAHRLRVERGDPNIAEIHLADAIESLTQRKRASLSDDRAAKDPYKKEARKPRIRAAEPEKAPG
jgi:hypothetical protein